MSLHSAWQAKKGMLLRLKYVQVNLALSCLFDLGGFEPHWVRLAPFVCAPAQQLAFASTLPAWPASRLFSPHLSVLEEGASWVTIEDDVFNKSIAWGESSGLTS